ncbi:dynein light chain Tctex-type 5-A-like [Genypterus blacodes]|uniref:dynein light chain Tctex-type 5-A-like n=1 Tax=Genypterus blacodes TaxID=154954 RepID=UPI003F76BA89
MSDQLKDRRKERRTSRAISEGSQIVRTFGKIKDSISTVSCMDDAGHHDDNTHPGVKLENTYQLGPHKRFPVLAVTNILKDMLTNYLQEETYEVEWSQQMTKTLCEVIKSHVKDLKIPRYKVVVMVHIGHITGQGLRNSSRCLWDASNDTCASYSFKNSSLFGVATVYATYFE